MNEMDFKDGFRYILLDLLLDKYERSQAFLTGESTLHRPQTSLNVEPFRADYRDEMNFRKREWMHEVVQELCSDGILDVKWERSLDIISKIYLQWEGISAAFQRLGRQSKKDKLEVLHDTISRLSGHPWEWVDYWSREKMAALKEQRSAGLDITDPESYADLVQVLHELPGIEGDIPKRMLSLRVFGNSKHFEQRVERRLLTVMRQGLGKSVDLSDGELDVIGIVSHPKPVLLAGLGRFRLNEVDLLLETFTDGVALFPETLKTFDWVSLDVERIITIENLSSYHQWIRVRQPLREIVVYTGGFPHRVLQSFLRGLWKMHVRWFLSVPIYHWGDIDIGGIQIHRFLQKDCASIIHPLFMDEQILERFGEKEKDNPEQYLRTAKLLLDNEAYAEWHPLLAVMAHTGLKVEQEAVPDQMVNEAFRD